MKPATLLAALFLVAGLSFGSSLRGQASPAISAQALTRGCFISQHNTVPVLLEIARTPAQRRYGLMERESLDSHAGMLFVYPEFRPPEHGFWMYNTRIPLDIAYLDDKGRIVSIRTMEPCPSEQGSQCPSYPAGTRFIRAVEMNAGFFSGNGIGVGDRLVTGNSDCPAR